MNIKHTMLQILANDDIDEMKKFLSIIPFDTPRDIEILASTAYAELTAQKRALLAAYLASLIPLTPITLNGIAYAFNATSPELDEDCDGYLNLQITIDGPLGDALHAILPSQLNLVMFAFDFMISARDPEDALTNPKVSDIVVDFADMVKSGRIRSDICAMANDTIFNKVWTDYEHLILTPEQEARDAAIDDWRDAAIDAERNRVNAENMARGVKPGSKKYVDTFDHARLESELRQRIIDERLRVIEEHRAK